MVTRSRKRIWKMVLALIIGLLLALAVLPEIVLWAVARELPALDAASPVPQSWLTAVAAAADSEALDVRDRTPVLGIVVRRRNSLAGILGRQLARCAIEEPLGLPSDWGRAIYGVALAREFRPSVLAGGVLTKCKLSTPEGGDESLTEFGERRLPGRPSKTNWDAATQLLVFVVGMSGLEEQPSCHLEYVKTKYSRARGVYCALAPSSCSLIPTELPFLGTCV